MNKRWEPEFDDWSEGKVSMSSCEIATSSSSRNEYGVMVQVGADEDDYPVDPAIFWTDETHLYLRYNWETWYKVSNDDQDNCSNICKRNSATLLLCTASSIKHHAVKVYHIDRLPDEMFGKQESEVSANAFNETDSAFLASKIIELGGRHITHYDRVPYQSDFYELNGHVIAASYFDHPGDWMADEGWEDGDTPVWFGAKGIATSPIAIACKIREALTPISATLRPFHSMVLISPRCNIINEINYFESWKDRSICLVRQQSIGDSGLGTVEDALRGFSGTSRPKLAEHASQIQAALDTALSESSS